MRALASAIPLALILSSCAHAKCPLIYFSLEGRIDGGFHTGESLKVEADLDPNAQPPQVKIADDRFQAELAFDSTRSGGFFWHNCSRRPRAITISLVRENGEEEARFVLDFKRDFERTPTGDYKARFLVELTRRR